MLGLQSHDHAKKRKENTSWSQATFVYFRAMPPRHLTPALVACHCRPPPLRLVAPSADNEYLMFWGARRSCGQFWMVYLTSTYVKKHTRNIVFAFYVVAARNQNRKYNFGWIIPIIQGRWQDIQLYVQPTSSNKQKIPSEQKKKVLLTHMSLRVTLVHFLGRNSKYSYYFIILPNYLK